MSKLLDFVVRCNTATEYDAIDDIIRMANPDSFDSQDEMSEHFEDCLGYDPFEYFDRKIIQDKFDELINTAPYSVQEQLRNKKYDIIERTIDSLDDINENILQKVFLTVIKDEIGWSPMENEEVSLDDCISMVVFGELIEDDYDESDDDEEQEDYADEDEDDHYVDGLFNNDYDDDECQKGG